MSDIGIIGLGDAGLPPAIEFGKRFRTVGFDVEGPLDRNSVDDRLQGGTR